MKKRTRPTQTIVELDHHRNGLSGLPFHVAIVKEIEDGRLYERVETQMNEIIMAAAVEQKLDRHCYAADLQSCLCEVPL